MLPMVQLQAYTQHIVSANAYGSGSYALDGLSPVQARHVCQVEETLRVHWHIKHRRRGSLDVLTAVEAGGL